MAAGCREAPRAPGGRLGLRLPSSGLIPAPTPPPPAASPAIVLWQDAASVRGWPGPRSRVVSAGSPDTHRRSALTAPVAEPLATFLRCHASHAPLPLPPPSPRFSSSDCLQLSRKITVRHGLGHNRGLHGGVGSSAGRHEDAPLPPAANMLMNSKKRRRGNRKGHIHQRLPGIQDNIC